jgi:hypothetical protein
MQSRDPLMGKSRHDGPEAEIFYENTRLQQNTVNAGFPVRERRRKAAGKPG